MIEPPSRLGGRPPSVDREALWIGNGLHEAGLPWPIAADLVGVNPATLRKLAPYVVKNPSGAPGAPGPAEEVQSQGP
jgi:hypothetical protein